MNLVSCIIPVYNAEKYLKYSIDSILRQTYQKFELIIINDGSTDSSANIIEGYCDARIRTVNQPHSGIVTALNAGLSMANGDFIARMDADDISLPNRFEIQVNFLLQNQDVVLVGGRSITIDSEGVADEDQSQTKTPRHGKRTITDFSNFPPKVATALHPLIMIRSNAIRAIGGYRQGYQYAEDYDMYLRIIRLGRIQNMEDVIFKYRFHGNNISIRHIHVQERSAARAEIDNLNLILAESGKENFRLSALTFEGYVQLRTFRREMGLGIRNYYRAASALKFIILGVPHSAFRASVRLLAMWIYNNGRYFSKCLQLRRRSPWLRTERSV